MTQTKTSRRAVFLDRDGTLIEMCAFRSATSPDEVKLLPKIAEGLRRLKSMGLMLVVVTNQGRISTGELTVSALHSIHDRLNELIKEAGGPEIEAFYFCPHKKDPCDCRKPKPGMIELAARELSIDLTKSYIIGDDDRDMRAGLAAGITRRFQIIGDIPRPNLSVHESGKLQGFDNASLLFSNFYDAAKSVSIIEGYSA